MWLLSNREAEIERMREVAAELSEQLAEARREIETVAALKMALAHERKQHAEAKTRAAKPAAPPTEPGGEDPRIAPSDEQAAMRNHLAACGLSIGTSSSWRMTG